MLTDSHVHLNDESFDEDLSDVFERARDIGVSRFLVPGWDVDSSRKAMGLCRFYPGMYFAAGIHPENIAEAKEGDLVEIEKLALEPRCVAVGECGLDYHYENDESTKSLQKAFFVAQIDLANKLGLPMSIHSRDAVEDTYALLSEHPVKAGAVLHCYGSSPEMLLRFAELGCYFGFDGPITFKNAVQPVKSLLQCPLDRLLLETDSPYMAPTPMRGRRNEPSYLTHIAQKAAEIKTIGVEEISEITEANFNRLFHVKQ